MENNRERIPKNVAKKAGKSIFYLIAVIILLVVAVNLVAGAIVIIDTGNKGVLKTWGKVTGDVFDEGLSFKMPIAQTVDILDVKTQKLATDASASSKDLQIVTSKIVLNYRVTEVAWLRQRIGMNYREKIIDPAIQEAIKASTALFTAEELITKRPLVRDEMETNLREKVNETSHGSIVIEQFSIIDFDFSPDFNKAIEAKVTAVELARKAENDLIRIRTEAEMVVATAQGKADARIAEATAEAEALRIQAQALKENNEILELRWIDKWKGDVPQIVAGSGQQFIYALPDLSSSE